MARHLKLRDYPSAPFTSHLRCSVSLDIPKSVATRKIRLPQFSTVESGFEGVDFDEIRFFTNFHPRIKSNNYNMLE